MTCAELAVALSYSGQLDEATAETREKPSDSLPSPGDAHHMLAWMLLSYRNWARPSPSIA